MRKLAVGVDLGATKILTGIMTLNGNIINKNKVLTATEKGPDYIMDQITAGIKSIIHDTARPGDEVVCVVLAVPGPLLWPEAIILDSPNLKWPRVSVKKEMEARLDMREVIVEHDASIAALGEYYFGQQKKYKHLIYITVSTGIGGGIVANGRLYRGAWGGAGEFGHMVVNINGEECGCGRRGCLEAIASGTAIGREAQKLINSGNGMGIAGICQPGENASAKEVAKACLMGDKEAKAIIDNVVQYLGVGLTNITNIFNPEIIILGGSVALGLKDYILEPLIRQVDRQAFSMHASGLRIDVTSLGENIGLLGCLARYLTDDQLNKI